MRRVSPERTEYMEIKRRIAAALAALALLVSLLGCEAGDSGETSGVSVSEDTPPLEYPVTGDTEEPPFTGEDFVTTEPIVTTHPVTDEAPVEPDPSEALVAEMLSDGMTYQAGDGTTVLQYSAGYPRLVGETEEATAKLNDAVLVQLEVLSHEAALLADSALLHYETSPGSFMLPYSFLVYCEAYEHEHGVSLVFRVTEYEGGPDGRERYSTMLLDRRTGETLQVAEDESAFWEDVRVAVTEELSRSTLDLFEDWEDLVGQYVRDCYYFVDGQMVILFGEYTVAPGISGVIRVVIDMAEVAVHMDSELAGDILM